MQTNLAKRGLSFLLALAMVFTMLPVQAFATEEEPLDHEHCEVCGQHDCICPPEEPEHVCEFLAGEVVEPTCGAAGYTVYTCGGCGAVENRDEVPATGAHTYVDAVVGPTETEQGYTAHTCSVCGHSYQDNFVDALAPAHVHEYVAGTPVAATPEAQGYTPYTCACGDSYNADFVAYEAEEFQREIPEDWSDEMVEIQELMDEYIEYYLGYYGFEMFDESEFAPIVRAQIEAEDEADLQAKLAELPDELMAQWEEICDQIEDIVVNSMDDNERENARAAVEEVEGFMMSYQEANVLSENQVNVIVEENPVFVEFSYVAKRFGTDLNMFATAELVNAEGYKFTFTDTAGNVTNNNGTITASVTVTSGKYDFLGASNSGTVTITNSSGIKGTVTFKWKAGGAVGGTGDTVKVNGTSGSKDVENTFTGVLAHGESVTAQLDTYVSSRNSSSTVNISIYDFNLVPLPDTATATVTCDTGLGTVVTGNGTLNYGETTVVPIAQGLRATPEAGAEFVAWVDADYKVVSYNEVFPLEKDQTYTLKAVFATKAWFRIGDKLYGDLNEADAVGGTIVLVNNGTLPAGDYTISSGNTLLIPMDEAGTVYTTEPRKADNTVETSLITPTAFRTLNMANGANITVAGAISVAGSQYAGGTGSVMGGVHGPVGFIKMAEGSKITVNNGAYLYAWGYVMGSGSVEVLSGGTAYESFQTTDWRGGSATSSVVNNNQNAVFPMNQYYVQNIEVPMKLNAGAKEKGYSCTTISYVGVQGAEVPFVGNGSEDSLFTIESGYLIKDYDEATDRQVYEVHGDVAMYKIRISMQLSALGGNVTLDSSEYVLPLTNNLTVDVVSGTIDITQNLAFLPGSEIIVRQNAFCKLADGKSVYVYDLDEWGGYCGHLNKTWIKLPYAPGRTGNRTGLTDAKIQIDGTVMADAGFLYTTKGGAIVVSTGGGKVNMKKGTATVTYQFTQNGTNCTAVEIPVVVAKLQNADGTTTNPDKINPDLGVVYTYTDGVWVADCPGDGTCVVEDGFVCQPKKCKYCDYTDSSNVAEHTPGAAATCTAAQTCTVCGTELAEALGHAYKTVPGQADSCKEGETGYLASQQCTRCNLHFSDTNGTLIGDGSEDAFEAWKTGAGKVDDAQHTPGKWTKDIAEGTFTNSTCIVPGSHQEYRICTNSGCGAEVDRKTVTDELADHSYIPVDGKADSCKDGVTGYKASFQCEVCKKHFSDNQGTLIGDGSDTAFEAWKTGDGKDDSAEHVSNGETVDCVTNETCKNCGGILTEKLGHQPKAAVIENQKDDGTYDEVVYCGRSGCGAEISRRTVNPAQELKHEIEQVPAKEPTCTEDGYTAGTKCVNENCELCAQNGAVYTSGMEKIPALGHTFEGASNITYTFDKENRKCTASAKCGRENCGADHSVTVVATMTETELGCTSDYTKTYTASFADIPGLKQTHTETETIQAQTGHDWTTEVSYTELEGAQTCTATQICGNKCAETRTSEVNVETAVVPATCTTAGYTTYTADFQVNWAVDQTKTVDGEKAKGHTWTVDENSVNWTEMACKLHCACGAAADAAFEVTQEVKQEDTCEQAGEILYTGTFKAEGDFEGDTMPEALTKTERPDAVQHNWGTPTYKWSQDYTQCTATRTCGVDDKHVETETVQATAGENTATCTADGKITHTSAAFKNTAFAVQTKDETTEALGHEAEFVEEVSPTCQETGMEAHYKCTREACGKLFKTAEDAKNNEQVSAETLIMRTGHDWGEYVLDEGSATCLTDGTKTASCTYNCGTTNQITAEGSKLDHVWGEYSYNNDATCLADGTKTASCTYGCGTTDEVPAENTKLDHSYKEEVLKAATCTAVGNVQKTCVNGCGNSYTEEIAKLGHVYELVSGLEATCYAEGWKDYYKCTRDNCGLYFANNGDTTSIEPETWKTGAGKTNKVAHDYKSVVTAPTCLTEGYTTYTCKNCSEGTEGHSYVADYKDALDHSYDAGVVTTQPTCTEAGVKTFTCQNDCCTEQTEGHTCTKPVEALGHVLVKIEGQASTCAETGYNAYYQCAEPGARTDERSYCGYYFANESDTTATATPIATTAEELTTWQEKSAEEGGGALALRECKDENHDHDCDYEDCDNVIGEHKDDDKNHVCDTYADCAKGTFGTHEENKQDQEHKCDYCREKMGDHVFTDGVCTCNYVQDLKVTITIVAEGTSDQTLPEESIKYGNNSAEYTKVLDLTSYGDCYTIRSVSAKVGGKEVESTYQGNTLTIASELLTGDIVITVNAHQSHVHGSTKTDITAAKCKVDGKIVTTLTCKNCGKPYSTETEIIPALEHEYNGVYTEPTFEADGFTTYTCKNGCGDSYIETDEDTKLIAVAMVGTQKFETLEEAIDAAGGIGAIILLDKYVVEGTQVWDLEDASLYIANVEGNYGLIIKGDLTIKGGNYVAQGYYGIGVQSGAKLTIDDGVFKNRSKYNDYVIGSWGTTVINGGEFAGQYNCINGFAGSLTINGGEFETKDFDATGEYESSDVFAEEGVSQIKGGSFSKSVEEYVAEGHCQKAVSGRYVVAAHIPGEAQEMDRVEADCTTSGSYKLVVSCTRCEAVLSSEDKTIDPLGHTVEVIAGKDADCLNPGYHEAYHCTVCDGDYATRDAENDKLLSSKIEDLPAWQNEGDGKIDALGHDLVHTEEVPAVCEVSGVKEYWQCSRCGAAFEDEGENTPITDLATWKAEGGDGYLKELGHDYTSEVTKAPTCTEDGVRTYTCQHDKSHTCTEVEPKLNHNYVVEYQWNEDRTACTAVAVCANDAYHKAQLNAVVTISVTTAADCENDGAGIRTAAFSENTYGIVNQVENVVIPATGHSFTKYVSDNNATCTENGTETAKCDNKCGTEDTRVVEDSAKGHSMQEIAEVPATCTNDGIIHHYYCSTCKGRFLDEQGKQSVETGKHIAPALQHEYTIAVTDPDCENQGYTTYTCICGDHTYQDNFVPALEHKWNEGEILKGDEPTCTEPGTRTYTCTRGCIKTETVKATGHKGQWIAGQAGTCTVAGWNAYYQCQNSCGLYYVDTNCTKLIGDADALETWKTTEGAGKTGPYGHDYKEVPGKTPDCDDAGFKASFKCNKDYCSQYFFEDEAGEKILIGDETAYNAWIAEGGAGYIKPNGHTSGEVKIENVIAPKCEEDGSHDEVTYCTVCEDEVSRVKVTDPKTNHANKVEIPAKAATCEATGLTAGEQCKDCGKTLVAQTTIAKLPHTEVDDEEVPATCTATGLTKGKHCSVCNTVITAQAEIPMVRHELSVDAESIKLPTCTVDGEQTLKCANCDYETTEILKATGHQSITAKDGKDPNCTTVGYEAYWQCGDCNVMFSDAEGKTIITDRVVIPATGHDYNWDGGNVITEPTCTAKGYTTHICRVCDFEMKDTYTDMASHTEVIDAAVPATCTATGLTEGKHCSVCNAELVKQQETQMVPHTEVIDAAVPATCTETGLTEGKHCSVCNEVLVKQEVVGAKGHKGFVVKGQAAKCEQDGWMDYYQCNGCKLFFQDLECTQPIADVDAWKVADDGGKIDQLDHSWDDGRVTTLPTCTEDGVKTFTCGNCNGTKTDAEPMLGHETEAHDAQHPTYYSAGWEAYETCTRCDYSTFKAIEPLGEPSVGTFEEFMTSLKLLEEYANDYAKANPGKDPLWLLIKYVRTGVDRYNSGSWNIMAGYEDEGFAEYVMKQEEAYNKAAPTVDDMINVTGIKNIKNFKIPNGQGVDFGHMFGTMDITYHNKNSINHADVSGWAGDLVDLLSTADRHDVTGTVDEMIKEIGETYLNHSIEGESDQFSQTDMYGDLDGYYFMNELIGQDYESGMLYSMMERYFVSGLTDEQRADYFLKNRLGGVTGKNEIRDAVFSEYTGNSVIATLEGTREFKQADVSDMRKACCYAFADYLCKLAGDYVVENENRHLSVFSSETSTLAPGITQQISKATTTDGKQVVYYTATADVTSPYVHVYANYKDNDPSLGWGMQRVRDQANAAQAKYGDPDSDLYIPNYNVIAAVNGAGYNMTTGEPSGVLMMGGVEYHAPNGGGFFGIKKDGTACLGSDEDYYDLKAKGELSEAIAIFGSTLVKDGKINISSNDYSRASRTAIGYTKTGKVVTMVMDGRQEPISCGGSMAEIAQVMLDAGCIYAVNLDGGGSTTYVARQEGEEELSLVSSPSDGFERSVSTSWLIVSTAPSSTAFDHAVLNSDVRHMTIGSTVQVTATGASATGSPAELPEGTTWTVSDTKVASIDQNGVVTALANGKFDVQLKLGDEVIGSRTLNVVVPDAVYFTKENMNAVYGEPATLPVAALYEGKPVAITEADVTFSLSNDAAGTTEGFTFTGIEASGIKTVKVNAHAVNNPDATSGAININLFKAGEASFDFENADGGDRLLAWNRVVSNSTTVDNVTYTVVDKDKPMVTEYTFGMDMTQIPIPEELNDLIYMLPGADVEGNNSAWSFLLQLAERVSVLTEVKATLKLDPNFDVDYSKMSVVCEYFTLESTTLNAETNELILSLRWKDQTKAIDPDTANPMVILAGIKLTPKADAAWNAKDQLSVVNSGNISYDIYLRANALYSFASKPENQEAYKLYPFVNPDVIIGGAAESGGHFSDVYKEFNDEYTLNKGAKNGWVYEDGGYAYYEDGEKYIGIQKVGQFYYDFGTNGINVGQTKFTGMFQINGVNHYAKEGLLTGGWHIDGEDKYYFDANGKAVDGEIVLDEVNMIFDNGLHVGGYSGFLKKSDGNTYYYQNGSMYYGWLELGDEWYHFNTESGIMTVGDGTAATKLFPDDEAKAKGAYYVFDAEGHALYGFPNNYGYYYWAGQPIRDKWVRNGYDLDGWYHTNDTGHFVTSGGSESYKLELDGVTYDAVKIAFDGVVYVFNDKNGKLLLGSMVLEDGFWYYYWAGEPVNDGWFEFEGETYYAYEDGKLASGAQTIDGKSYMFTERGILIKEGTTLNVIMSNDLTKMTLKVNNVKDVERVMLAMWSDVNGQDDLEWFEATNDGEGIWTIEIDPLCQQYKDIGRYQIHAYEYSEDGTMGDLLVATIYDLAKIGHKTGEPVKQNVVAPTCTSAGGYDLVTICEACNETVDTKHVVEPAVGNKHVYDDNVDGTCNVCGVDRATVEKRQVVHMLRMYNPYSGEHFYTGSEEEKDNLVAAGWHYEGVAFTFPANTGAPVYRLYDPVTGEHLYTMDEEEKATLEAAGWNYEGIAFNSAYDTEAVQHRLHNPYATVGAYHFTFSEEEMQNLINAGWEYQGIGWYSCWK